VAAQTRWTAHGGPSLATSAATAESDGIRPRQSGGEDTQSYGVRQDGFVIAVQGPGDNIPAAGAVKNFLGRHYRHERVQGAPRKERVACHGCAAITVMVKKTPSSGIQTAPSITGRIENR
jgi:hypothetical protein